MADGRHVRKYLKCHNSPTNGPTGMQLFVVASHHVLDMSAMLRLPWQRPLSSNSALNILQLWASGGRTREPILMKFGTQQQVRNTMTDTWSNTKIFKIQNGGRSLLENSRNGIIRLPMDRLGRNLSGRIPSCSQYWKYYNSSYDGTDWDDSWVGASKQHFCCKTVSLVLVVTANSTVNVVILWGVQITNIHTFHETCVTVPLWYKKI